MHAPSGEFEAINFFAIPIFLHVALPMTCVGSSRYTYSIRHAVEYSDMQ